MGWRGEILRHFPSGAYRLTLVADPDGLLTEEGVAAGLRERGFETLAYGDPIAFRYAYETGYRARWELGEKADLVVVFRGEAHELDSLPYDLLRLGRTLACGLGDLFPNLSYPVVAALGRANLDVLYAAHSEHARDRLGHNATADFVLRYVFGVAPELIRNDSDLLSLLLRRHYEGWDVPEIVEQRLLQHLRSDERFADWSLGEIATDRNAFFAFLQERWPIFLDRLVKKGGLAVEGDSPTYAGKYPGPRELPFESASVRVHVDDLFLEDLLRPTHHPASEALADSWVSVGLRTEPQEDDRQRFEGLLASASESIPEASANRHEWLAFAQRWSELTVLRHRIDVPRLDEEFLSTRKAVDASFLTWMMSRYGGLHNVSAPSPTMVHHVPHYLARQMESGRHDRVALVVIDGLALDQWVVLRDTLSGQLPALRLHGDAAFAWVPTITPVSRQAIFAGSPPVYFSGSIRTTSKEPSLWRRFWADSLGLGANEVMYLNATGDGDAADVQSAVSHPKVRVVGVVVRKVDDIMHGMELGTRGMHNQVRQWAEEGYPKRLIETLLGEGFSVYLTSDHGNVGANGIGRPAEGAIAEMRGERVRVYSDPRLRTRVAERFPDAMEWPGVGLPRDYLPLLAPGRTAFVSKDRRIVGHGGTSLEEAIVPFIRITSEIA